MERKVTPCFACKHMYADVNLEPCKSCRHAAEKARATRDIKQPICEPTPPKIQSEPISREK
jgi:hypothetical protein